MTMEEARNEFEKKVKKGIFKPVARHIRGPDMEDRIQEGLGLVYEMYARYATQKNTVLPDAILVHSCKQRSADRRRRLVRDDARPGCDVLNPVAYLSGNVEVLRIDGLVDESGEFKAGDDVERSVAGMLSAEFQVNPVRTIISKLDLEAWMKGLPRRDRRMLTLRACGYTLKEIGTRLGLTVSTVFARLRALGFALSDRAGLPLPATKPSLA